MFKIVDLSYHNRRTQSIAFLPASTHLSTQSMGMKAIG